MEVIFFPFFSGEVGGFGHDRKFGWDIFFFFLPFQEQEGV